MDDRERHEERAEEQTEERPDALEDMDVPQEQAEDLKGGTFKQGWPVKWQGTS